MYMAVLYSALTVVTIYMISLLIYIVGNFISKNKTQNKENAPVSVIVAIKNGEESLPHLLNDLENQHYKGECEFIIVDDQSNDNTKNIIQESEQKNKKIKYVSSSAGNNNLFLKKRALDAGIKMASHEILIFTDVDCRLKNTWLESMTNCFDNNVDYVIGYSEISNPSNLISWFQKIDLLMMMTAGRATCNLNKPFACTGQNQAYKKSLYKKIGFLKINSIQGDDSLFMQLCTKEKIKIIFNDNKESFVESRMETNMMTFIKQRMRWAGDAKVMWNYNKGYFIIFLSTFLTNFLLLLSPFIIILYKNFWQYLVIIFAIKFILEGIIYIIGSTKLHSTQNPIMFICWYIIEIPYIVLMGIGSFFVKYIGWKGQKIAN